MSSILGDIIDDHYKGQDVVKMTTLKDAENSGMSLTALIMYMKQMDIGSVLLKYGDLFEYNPKVELTLFPNDSILVKIVDE